MGLALKKDDLEEIASIFVGQMTPLLEQRDAEIKAFGDKLAETQQAIDRANAAITEIETKAKRPNLTLLPGGKLADGGSEDAETKAAKAHAFYAWVRGGYRRLPAEQRALLTTAESKDIDALQAGAKALQVETKAFSLSDDTLGGYFVLPEMVQDEIIKASVLFSPVRQLARVQQTANNSVEIPVRKATLTAGWISETGTRTESLGQSYGKSVIPTHEMYAYTIFSRQMLEDAYLDLQAELLADIAEQFGVVEGTAFVNGSGVGQPQGFLANVTTNVNTAAGSTAITYADLVKTFFKLKPAYRNSPTCKWAFNQAVLSAIRQITDSNGRPIFQPFAESGLSADNPGTILGKPYVECNDMPSAISGTNRTVAVGDFQKAYRFVDRVTMSVQRLEELLALSGQVGLIVHKRVGGQLVLEEALAVLKQS